MDVEPSSQVTLNVIKTQLHNLKKPVQSTIKTGRILVSTEIAWKYIYFIQAAVHCLPFQVRLHLYTQSTQCSQVFRHWRLTTTNTVNTENPKHSQYRIAKDNSQSRQ